MKNSLWAEDGVIFFNQAKDLNVKSILQPYNGYIHFYPRVIALVNSLLPFSITPYSFLFGWLISYLSVVYIFIRKAKEYRVDNSSILAFTLLLALEPSGGEVFFNLTNAQWYLGVALIVNCALPSAGRMRILESAFIVVAALTGPFSIYLMPVLLAKMVLFGDFEVRRREYITISICGAIQLFYVLISPRIYEKGVVDHDIWHWTHVLWTLLTFGNSLPWASIVWILFWLIWIWILLSYCVERLREGDKAFLFAVCAFVVLGCAILASGLFVGREFPGWFTPMGFGSRYFVPLYILSFLLIAIAASERHYLKWFLLTLYARS